MFNIFKSKAEKFIEKADELRNIQSTLNQRKLELNILRSNDFKRFNRLTIFADEEYAKVDGYTRRFTIQGSIAREIIEKFLELEIQKLEREFKNLERTL